MVGFVAERDSDDHVRFSPLQTTYAQTACNKMNLPTDVSTAVLIETKQDGSTRRGYTHSAAVLRLFHHMGFPYTVLGRILLFIPSVIRDFGYKLFARNRGKIWKVVKQVTRIGDTMLDEHRDRIVGLVERGDDETHLEPGWGFTLNDQKHGDARKNKDE